MTYCRHISFLLTVVFVMSFCHAFSDRSNSKRLRWDKEPAKQLDLINSPYSHIYYDSSKGDREKMFINNMAYDLSKKDQGMMWDLYLRKGYGPSLSTLDNHYEDLPSLSSHNFKGTAVRLGAPVDASKEMSKEYYMGSDYNNNNNNQKKKNDNNNNLRNYPNAIASRILDQYEITKSSRIAPEYEIEPVNEIFNNEQRVGTTHEPITIRQPSVEDSSASDTKLSTASLLSYLWDTLKDNFGELLGREMRETIINTLWSWWMYIVEFANARGKRSIEGLSF